MLTALRCSLLRTKLRLLDAESGPPLSKLKLKKLSDSLTKPLLRKRELLRKLKRLNVLRKIASLMLGPPK